MIIKKAELFLLDMPLKFTFKTSQTSLDRRETIILKVTDESGNTGYGEVVAFSDPFYTSETLADAKRLLLETYLPRLLQEETVHPFDIHAWLDRAYPMTGAGVENALLDVYARRQDIPVMAAVFLEETNTQIEAGMVLGDLDSAGLLKQIEQYLQEGYVRFKIKIKPQDGFAKLNMIRTAYPYLKLLADANRSFRSEHIPELMKIDGLGLLCLEEPLAEAELTDYQKLQAEMQTPVCLDESILNVADLEKAIELKACRALNSKAGRVGGLFYVRQMIELCRKHHIYYWIGSMVESGISKILHVHLASLKDTYIPGDLSPSQRYFPQDIIRPEVTVQNGRIEVPRGPGLGIAVDENILADYTVEHHIFA